MMSDERLGYPAFEELRLTTLNDITEMQEQPIVHRPMSKYMQRKLRERFCKRQLSYLWGQKRFVKPELLPFVFGDGKRIIAVRPIITRTHHFVVAVDSSIVHERDVHDIIDDIYEVHEEYFGACGCDECYSDGDESDDIRFKQWPVIVSERAATRLQFFVMRLGAF